MKNEIEIIRKIKTQLAYIMASYGDEPAKLMDKLEALIIDWYGKGLDNYRQIDHNEES